MIIEALIIGNEILTGRRKDAHLSQTIHACETRGLRLSAAHFLGDDPNALENYYREALKHEKTILSFGGIGATPDDRTRQAVAKAGGVPLVAHPEGDALLRDLFQESYNEQRRRLIEFPSGALLIPNPINQVPGFSWQKIHCVPGFPEMATPMIAWVLDQYYLPLATHHHYEAIDVFAPESELSAIMETLEKAFPRVSISSLPKMRHETELGFDGAPEEVRAALAQAKKILDQNKIYWAAC